MSGHFNDDNDDRDDDIELHSWTLVKIGEHAYGVAPSAGESLVWLPKSQVRGGNLDDAYENDDDVWFVIPRWLADDRGIDYNE